MCVFKFWYVFLVCIQYILICSQYTPVFWYVFNTYQYVLNHIVIHIEFKISTCGAHIDWWYMQLQTILTFVNTNTSSNAVPFKAHYILDAMISIQSPIYNDILVWSQYILPTSTCTINHQYRHLKIRQNHFQNLYQHRTLSACSNLTSWYIGPNIGPKLSLDPLQHSLLSFADKWFQCQPSLAHLSISSGAFLTMQCRKPPALVSLHVFGCCYSDSRSNACWQRTLNLWLPAAWITVWEVNRISVNSHGLIDETQRFWHAMSGWGKLLNLIIQIIWLQFSAALSLSCQKSDVNYSIELKNTPGKSNNT